VEAFSLLMQGFSVLLTWKILALMLVGLLLGIFVGVLPVSAVRTALRSCCR
jgi:TctA family transporter